MRSAMYADEEPAVTEKRHAVESFLMPGEEILDVAAISPGIYWKGIGLLLVAAIALIYSLEMALFFAIVAGILLLVNYTTRRFLTLVVTTKRLVIGGGFFSLEVLNLPYSKIEGVEVFRSIPGMLFGYSNIILTGTGRMKLLAPYIANAGNIMQEITERILERENIRATATIPA